MPDLPVNAPENLYVQRAQKRLANAVKEAGSRREFARKKGVNILYVSQLLNDGIEPTDNTPKGQEIRVKLFLPKKKPKPTSKPRRPDLPGERRVKRIISKMAKDTKRSVLRQ